MTSRTRSAPGRRRTTRVVRGLLALAAILALVIGIPVALIALAGNPLPDSAPTWNDVTSALTAPDDGTLFLTALTWLAWLGWASFAVGVLVEIIAAVRGRPAPRIRLLGFQQRAAAGLVTAVVAVFIVGPVGMATATTPASATPSPPPTAEAQQASTATPQAPPATAPQAAESTTDNTTADVPATRTHTVQSGESLWRIAADHLGDGARWPEIAELNYGVQQPDGGALDRNHWIAPGWQLDIPADADSAAERPADEAAEATTHVVVEGDTLWDIAEQKLGDGARYPEIFEASRHTVQPDGRRLTDPDLIIPGWTMTIPVAAPPSDDSTEDQPREEEPDHEQPPPDQPPVDEEPPVDEPPVDEEPPVDDTIDDDAGGQDQAEFDGPGASTADIGDADFPVRTTAGIGSLLAAGVLAYLAAKRRSQQRHRRFGERIAMPTGATADAERELRGVADPISVESVDLALRGLAASCAQRGVPLPALRVARLTADQFELYLAEPAELPAPFVATEQEHVWFLPAAAVHDTPSEQVAEVAAPYPSLVTIGHGPEQGHLLLDLERLGALTLTGPDELSQQVMAALAVELATSPWADDLQVTLVGTCADLASGLDTGRVRHLPSVGTLLDELSLRAEHDRAALTDSGAQSLDEARVRGLAPAAWTPEIVLLAEPLTSAQHEQLIDLVDELPRVAVAAVTNDDDAPSTWSLELDADDPDVAVLQPVGVEVSPQRLDDDQYRRILDLLGIAEQASVAVPTPEPEPIAPDGPVTEAPVGAPVDSPPRPLVGSTVTSTPPAPSVADLDAELARLDTPRDGPTILLLGPVEVDNATGPIEQSKYRQLTEIAAYIALNPGLGHAALDEAIWPGNRVTQNTRNTAISKLRRWFGSDGRGEDYLPRVDNGYRFHPAVGTDWDAWTRYIGPDPRIAGTDQLLQALELVRGQPFTGVNPRRYGWAEHLKQEMIAAIVDAAHELAQRGLRAGDPYLARKAATIGLQAEPGMEVLWRDRIEAEHLAGNRAGIDDAVARLTAITDDLGDDLEEATVNLIQELVPGRSAGVPFGAV